MYLKHAVLFKPQFSFTSASEIHVFGDNFLFYNRNLSIIFVWKEGCGFFQTKRKNRWVPGLASEKKADVSFSQVMLYGKSRHFVYVRALIMPKILRSTGCAMQYWGITLKDIQLRFCARSNLM